MRAQLILIEGPLGSGKSSLARFLARSAQRAGLPAGWILEHTRPHPTHAYRKLPNWQQPWQDLSTTRLIEDSLAGWRGFVEQVRSSGQTRFSAGAVCRGDLEALFRMDCPPADLRDYAAYILRTVQPLDPVMINLYELNFMDAIERQVRERGTGWLRFQVAWAALTPYCQNRGWKGMDAWVGLQTDFHELCQEIYRDASLPRLELDVTDRDWPSVQTQALDWLEIPASAQPASARQFYALYDHIYDLVL